VVITNELYLTVLPIIHFTEISYPSGRTEQVLTLFPEKDFATEFFKDEIENYLNILKSQLNRHLVGGHVKNYVFSTEETKDGRFIVKVIQNVA
jgi:hypothetical protein